MQTFRVTFGKLATVVHVMQDIAYLCLNSRVVCERGSFFLHVFTVAEKSSLDEVKKFYNDHSSTVFYVVYGSFTQVEQTIMERGAYMYMYMHVHMCICHMLTAKVAQREGGSEGNRGGILKRQYSPFI